MIEMRLPDPTTVTFLLGLKRIHFRVTEFNAGKCSCCEETVQLALVCWSNHLVESELSTTNTFVICLGLCLQALVSDKRYSDIIGRPIGYRSCIEKELTNDD